MNESDKSQTSKSSSLVEQTVTIPGGSEIKIPAESNQVMPFSLSLGSIKDLVEVAGKLVIGFIAVCYAIGLLVVNVHLSKYGAYSMSLFRLNYIAAGVWALLPILFPFAILFIGFLITKLRKYHHTKGWIDTLLVPIVLLLLFTGFSIILLKELRVDFWHSSWVISVLGGFMILIYFFFPILIYNRGEKDDLPLSSIMSPITSILTICFVIFSSIYFALEVYQYVPSHIGGGKPQTVQIIVEAEKDVINLFDKAGLTFQKEAQSNDSNQAELNNQDNQDKSKEEKINRQSNDLELIMITESDLIIKGNNSTVSIPKDSVKAILYKNPKNP